jgi:hypothetical protein
MKLSKLFMLSFLVFSLIGCDEESEKTYGGLSIEVWGEEFIETGIPAGEFEDGWSIVYHKFLVNINNINTSLTDVSGFYTLDLTKTGPFTIFSETVSTGEIKPIEYSINPADTNSLNINIETADFELMKNEGYSVYVSGEATKDGSTISFEWGFTSSVTYENCDALNSVVEDSTSIAQLTIHGDHLFYESMVDPEAGLRFQAIVDADANNDQIITKEELQDFSGVSFQSLDNYDVPAESQIDNLWDYLSAQIETIGHIDGEGHCHIQ